MPVKILQVCRLTPLWGMDLYREITQAYNDPRYTVTTIFLSGKRHTAHYQGQVIHLQLNHKHWTWRFKAIWKLWRICRKENYDIVLCHHYKPTLVMHWVCFLAPITKRYSIHHNFGNFRKMNRRFMARFFLNKTWRFISVSNGIKADLIKSGIPCNKIDTVYNAIPTAEIQSKQYDRKTARELLKIPSQAIVFGHIGRLVASKGQHYLLQAFAKTDLPSDSYLVLIGTGELEQALKREAITLGIADRFILASHLAPEANRYLAAFDIFVLPSLQEGFGLVLLEAMAARVPIIASHVGGIPEVITQECGLLALPANIDDLRTAMLRLFKDPELRLTLSQAAYNRLQTQFSQRTYHLTLRSLLS